MLLLLLLQLTLDVFHGSILKVAILLEVLHMRSQRGDKAAVQ
jgi:hypothetical protein